MIKPSEKTINRWIREIKKYREGKTSNTFARKRIEEFIQECKKFNDMNIEETLIWTEKTLRSML